MDCQARILFRWEEGEVAEAEATGEDREGVDWEAAAACAYQQQHTRHAEAMLRGYRDSTSDMSDMSDSGDNDGPGRVPRSGNRVSTDTLGDDECIVEAKVSVSDVERCKGDTKNDAGRVLVSMRDVNVGVPAADKAWGLRM